MPCYRSFFILMYLILLALPCVCFGKQTQSSQEHIRKKLITIDPGHGGVDFGACSNNIKEKDLALKTALLAKKHLNRMGFRVILTRTRDLFLPLPKRVAIANDTKSRLFISIHYNAHLSSEARGIEIYYYKKGGKKRIAASQKLSQNILSRLTKRTKAPSRGMKHGNFHVIRETHMPAILIEGGFITNQKDATHLKDMKYIDQIAQAIAEGVNRYFYQK